MVRARFRGSNTVGELAGSWDDNGPLSGCANDQIYFIDLWYHKICEEVVGCSVERWH